MTATRGWSEVAGPPGAGVTSGLSEPSGFSPGRRGPTWFSSWPAAGLRAWRGDAPAGGAGRGRATGGDAGRDACEAGGRGGRTEPECHPARRAMTTAAPARTPTRNALTARRGPVPRVAVGGRRPPDPPDLSRPARRGATRAAPPGRRRTAAIP